MCVWEGGGEVVTLINHLRTFSVIVTGFIDEYSLFSFSSPEAVILLVSTKNQGLCPIPIFEHAQKSLSIIFSQSDLSDLTMSP